MQSTTIHTGRVSLTEALIDADETFVFDAFASAAPATLAVHPSPGATATVSYTVSTPARIAAGTARWLPAAIGEDGVVSAPAATDIPAPVTALRVVAALGEVVVEVAQ